MPHAGYNESSVVHTDVILLIQPREVSQLGRHHHLPVSAQAAEDDAVFALRTPLMMIVRGISAGFNDLVPRNMM